MWRFAPILGFVNHRNGYHNASLLLTSKRYFLANETNKSMTVTSSRLDAVEYKRHLKVIGLNDGFLSKLRNPVLRLPSLQSAGWTEIPREFARSNPRCLHLPFVSAESKDGIRCTPVDTRNHTCRFRSHSDFQTVNRAITPQEKETAKQFEKVEAKGKMVGSAIAQPAFHTSDLIMQRCS